jgi:uncharacterized membrane protein affecting hemolysin expression
MLCNIAKIILNPPENYRVIATILMFCVAILFVLIINAYPPCNSPQKQQSDRLETCKSHGITKISECLDTIP